MNTHFNLDIVCSKISNTQPTDYESYQKILLRLYIALLRLLKFKVIWFQESLKHYS